MIRNKFKKYVITLLPILLLICGVSCSVFNQNDFISSEIISDSPEEKIYYDVYQVGIDNYRFEFKAVTKTDTTKLFEYLLNDTIYKSMKFNTSKTADTLIIKINFPADKISTRTKAGTIIMLITESTN